jgi:AraC-like DNA-binding protein
VYEQKHDLYKNNDNPFSFFEIKLRKNAIEKMFPEKLWTELTFFPDLFHDHFSYIDSVNPITPGMKNIIGSLIENPFKGTMEEVFTEAKIVELFLLQVDNHKTEKSPGLRKKDIDKLIATKEYIDKNYRDKIRIIDLARFVGTNQQTLKTGFKDLFGTTIFGYYNDLRMEMAKHLLIEENKQVSEVAEEIGYKNPHHFTAAFKRTFGVLPSELKGKKYLS